MESQGKLLIVDDELSVRDSLGKWFKEEGYEIGTAESASDALTRMAENKWDLALLDIKMRGTDGIELQRPIDDAGVFRREQLESAEMRRRDREHAARRERIEDRAP